MKKVIFGLMLLASLPGFANDEWCKSINYANVSCVEPILSYSSLDYFCEDSTTFNYSGYKDCQRAAHERKGNDKYLIKRIEALEARIKELEAL
jgi:hypothetical protein